MTRHGKKYTFKDWYKKQANIPPGYKNLYWNDNSRKGFFFHSDWAIQRGYTYTELKNKPKPNNKLCLARLRNTRWARCIYESYIGHAILDRDFFTDSTGSQQGQRLVDPALYFANALSPIAQHIFEVAEAARNSQCSAKIERNHIKQVRRVRKKSDCSLVRQLFFESPRLNPNHHCTSFI